MANPVKARSTIQAVESTRIPVSRATIAAIEANALNARTCPTRRTSRGASRQEVINPPAQAVPKRPREVVEKPSAPPRNGKSKPCRPDAMTRKEVPQRSAKTWMNERNTADPSSESGMDQPGTELAIASSQTAMRRLDGTRITLSASAEQSFGSDLAVILARPLFLKARNLGTQQDNPLVKLRDG